MREKLGEEKKSGITTHIFTLWSIYKQSFTTVGWEKEVDFFFFVHMVRIIKNVRTHNIYSYI